MAGMLPGVESARRRRFSGWSDPSSVMNSGFGSARTTRHSNDAYVKPTSFLQRSMVNQLDDDDKLGGVAREAKERLDGRLRGHLKKEITRQSSQERLTGVGRRSTASSVMIENLQMEVYGLKKNGLKRLSWGRMGLSWKSSKQDECAICLDHYKAREKITVLPCAHRFHSDCLLPWLESNAHCPCCRATVFGSN
ncbi:zinc finger, RING/FYVE/PHD-type [Artemisia annua]|uniref:Zinc finger, RING/FYVE/PHD-type n=1 Tax=Artemisia annua TaxID=35608 RepID=A0A2U1KVQ2_ARTAN|nr:zinc finger, RING/FYVE/PHD-type [Artemisia annua]